MKSLIVVRLKVLRAELEHLYDELVLLQKRNRAGHVRYALKLVWEGRYVARPVVPVNAPEDIGPIVIKLQFNETDPEYAELERLSPVLRSGPLRAKLLIYCQGGTLVDAGPAALPSSPLASVAPSADDDIAAAFSASVEPLTSTGA
jgi:hypothetical protein